VSRQALGVLGGIDSKSYDGLGFSIQVARRFADRRMFMVATLRRYPLAFFVVLAYAISWAAWLPLLVRGEIVVPGGPVTHFPGLLGPAAAAFIMTALTQGRQGLGRLFGRMGRVSKPSAQFLLYSLSPLAFLALALVVAVLTGQPLPPLSDFWRYSGLPALPLLSVLSLVLLFNGLGEETGWRGFALERLQGKFGPVRGTLALGLIWAGWHTPSFWFVEGYRNLGFVTLVFGFGLGICAGSVVLARVLNRTQGSVLAAAVWHAVYNMSSATTASHGVIGAVTTTCVMVWACLLLFQEWRSPMERSRLAVGDAT
jgi:membrane protease YdiL (CAAX protease family)